MKTNPQEDSVKQYLDEIGKIPLIDAAEEVRLAKRIEIGMKAEAEKEAYLSDENQPEPDAPTIRRLERQIKQGVRAEHSLVEANLRLVVHQAKKYPRPAGTGLLDLVQYGNLGLQHATRKFDWQKGFKFSTYATFWIRQAIGRGLSSSGSTIHIPDEHASRLRSALSKSGGDAEKLPPDLYEIWRMVNTVSADSKTGEDGDQDMWAWAIGVPSFEHGLADQDEITQFIELVQDRICPRVWKALQIRFQLDGWEPANGRVRDETAYRVIGDELGITSEASRRVVQRGLASALEIIVADNDSFDRKSRRAQLVSAGVTDRVFETVGDAEQMSFAF